MRLIDADALVKDIEDYQKSMVFHSYGERMHFDDMIDFAIDHIEEAPTVDAVPKQSRRRVQFVPCVCGYNKHSEWRDTARNVWFYDCLKCGIKSDQYAAKTKTEAKIGWNKMIEELKAGEVDG